MYFVSFHQDCLGRVADLMPGARRGLIFSKQTDESFDRALEIGAHEILPKFTLLSGDLVQKSHEEQIQVIPWTLNRESEFEKAERLLVDGFATDDPCGAKQFFRTERGG